jgi:hypothetical protein
MKFYQQLLPLGAMLWPFAPFFPGNSRVFDFDLK